jgi:hypothetical protein
MADVTVNLSGLAATASPGTPIETGSANVTPTGVAATAMPGSPTITGDANVSISGRTATVHAGDPILPQTVSVNLLGQQAFVDPGVLFNNLVPDFMCCENSYRLQTIFGDRLPIPPPPPEGCTLLGWQYDGQLTSQSFHTLCWSPDLGIMVAGGNASNTATTTDGTNWTQHTAATNAATNGIAWAQSLGIFVGVGQVGRTRHSSNGISWTEHTPVTGTPTFNSVAWSPSLNLFVATRSTATAVCVWTSPDGTNWTPITTPVTTQSCRQVIWVDALNLFVICGSLGLIMTSADGASWTIQTTPDSTHLWTGIAWSPTLSLLVACSSTRTGSDNRTMRSADATSWTLGSSPSFASGDYSFSSIAWSSTLAMFAMVGIGSTGGLSNGVVAHSLDGVAVVIDTLPAPPGPPFRFDFVAGFDSVQMFIGINQVDEGGGFMQGLCADVTFATRLAVVVDGFTVLSVDVEATDPLWIPSGSAGLVNNQSQGAVNPADIASWDDFSITGNGGYSFADDFNRADADDLGVGYDVDQIGAVDAPFHIVSDQYQDWMNANVDPVIALAVPADCPPELITITMQIKLSAFGSLIGSPTPSQVVEFAARATSNTLSGSSHYYLTVQADPLDPSNGFAALYHVHFPDADPANAVFNLLGDKSSINIDVDSVIKLTVVNL